ncbi:TRAP transporter small permease subunit [Phaeobacter sp. J2-8]|uniref:TRAP transporter small permease subunit n=1 Tax=Phaeobacter sp. J2-8 TaxID=2931394 RepID=UPI001FCFEEB3|nr:TRAP transporter small permease subunit [Phaeobacter sp. J2-8]MCJ7871449.1 TRAP transporter small permease subunit [Phaeobacter sp. J2-8]
MQVLLKLAGICEIVVAFLGKVAMICVFGIIVTVTANVLVRYLFGIGTVWTQELEWHFLAVVATLGVAYTYQKGEHVRVDIIYKPAGPRTRAAIDLAAALSLFVIAILICNYTIPYVQQSWRSLEGSADPGGLPMRYALKATIVVGFMSLLLQAAAETIRNAHILISGEVETK